jgi:hypothetical protein
MENDNDGRRCSLWTGRDMDEVLTEKGLAAKQENHASGKQGKNEKANDSTTSRKGIHGIQALEFRR